MPVRAEKEKRMWKRIFDMENPLMRALATICDLLVLNVLTALCCLPVVTAGAALTALADVSLRIVRSEDAGVARGFLRAFRSNLRQGVPLGALFLFAAAVLYVDYFAAAVYAPPLRAAVIAAALIVGAIALYAFALLARYENTVRRTLGNAASLAIACFPRTMGMLLFTVGLWGVCLYFYRYALPVLLLFGLSLPAYVAALLMDSIFRGLEADNKEEIR